MEHAEEVLESLMDYVDGGTNKFKNIGVVKNKIDALRKHLTEESNEFNDEEVKVYNNKCMQMREQVEFDAISNDYNELKSLFKYKVF